VQEAANSSRRCRACRAPLPPPGCGAESRTPPRPGARHPRAGQPGFVLHSYPYKETSLIVDMFTRDHGRIGVVAKGAKRPLSKLRGVLQTFQPLSVPFPASPNCAP
jgi:DNA repair protein RecO (recombination protein O)